MNHRPSRRPFRIFVLASGLFILTGFNLVRIVEALRQWELLDEMLAVSPLYIALTGIIWAAAGLVGVLALWFGKACAPVYTRWFVAAYIAYYWLDRLIFSQGGQNPNWPFAAAASLLILGLTFWILASRKAKAYFRR